MPSKKNVNVIHKLREIFDWALENGSSIDTLIGCSTLLLEVGRTTIAILFQREHSISSRIEFGV